MAIELGGNVSVTRGPDGRVRGLNHIQAPYPGQAEMTAGDLAISYLKDATKIFGIDDAELGQPPRSPDEPDPGDDLPRLAISEEKSLAGSTTVGFGQWLHGLRIWEAGISVTLQDTPLQVLTAHSEYRPDVDVGWIEPDVDIAPGRLSPEMLGELLGIEDHPGKTGVEINSEGAWWLYRYDPDERHHPESLDRRDKQSGREKGPPTLDLPPVDRKIRPGAHYPVVEVLFRLSVPLWGEVNWRAFVEPVTGSVLYLRALVACATGRVYLTDPTVQTGNLSLRANAATTVDLDAQRSPVSVAGLDAPSGGTQALRGEFVAMQDTNAPTIAPPTEPSPFEFVYSSPTDHFAAIATYHHCDAAFRLVENLGFDVATYFNNTTFPVPIDHRGMTAINASCEGNAAGNGVGRMRFGPCDVGTTVGMGTEGRTVLHEFGHALLWDSVDSPNFGFAHSAGDALAMIVTDPHTLLSGADRFIVFTFCPLSVHRRADRDVSAGWAWGGSRDTGGYSSEEILCTTLFRLYRALGGDSARQDAQEFASRYAAYLIIRAIGSLATSPVTPTPEPDDFTDALMAADVATTNFEGYSGGSMHKVIRWSFEKQGLYQPAGAATPVTTAGAPPAVDVYIDDGRNGEYQFRENFWDTTDIWNRRSADGSLTHEEPIVGQPNYVYVRVKNRGGTDASDVVVRGYHSRPMTGLIWPADWEPMTTAMVELSGTLASGASAILGPFEWTPDTVGHDCLLMIASADGDPSVVDAVGGTVTGSIPHWRLVPFDNNIAQRNVAPIPSGSREQMVGALGERPFTIANGLENEVIVTIEVTIPRLLRKLGWRVKLDDLDGERFELGPREEVEVRLRLIPGKEVSRKQLEHSHREPRIEATVLFDETVVGGMTFPISASQGSYEGDSGQADA